MFLKQKILYAVKKNIAIIVGGISSRSAILGGVSPEVALTLCDAFVRKMEKIQDSELTIPMLRMLQYQYTLMVKEAKEGNQNGRQTADLRVDRAKAYIFSHAHEKITLADVAKDQDINPHTLAALFRRKVGSSIGEFIMEKKILLVKGELIYSNRPYGDIATNMGFSSQSHLGAVFKRHMGMTLHQYRQAFSALASINE